MTRTKMLNSTRDQKMFLQHVYTRISLGMKILITNLRIHDDLLPSNHESR